MLPPPAPLSLGARGPDVLRLQQALAGAGFDPGTSDGTFGEATARALRSFQTSKKLTVDGRAGAATWAALAAQDSFTAAPPSAQERAKFDQYAAQVRAAGGEVNPDGRPTVLALRTGRAESVETYAERFVVLTRDGRATELTGSTKPSARRASKDSQDADGDGAKDLGILRPGSYQVRPWTEKYKATGLAAFVVQRLDAAGQDSKVPAWRDTTHDLLFSDEEKASSERRGDTATEILFHAGGKAKPSSVGCLTFTPDEMKRLIAVVGGPAASFNLTLVQAQA